MHRLCYVRDGAFSNLPPRWMWFEIVIVLHPKV